MKRLAAILILFAASTCSATFSGYTYRRTITISSSNVAGIVTNFPVLISTVNVVYSTNVSGGHFANSGAYDSAYSTMSDCSFLLKYDTETYNNSGSTATNVWIKLPTITTNTLTAATFYWCYGNSSITSYQGDKTNVWDSNYAGVWHFPDGVTLGALDSTSNAKHGTVSNVTAAVGEIDGAGNYNGTSASIDVGSSVSLSSPVFTYSAWVNIGATGVNQTIMCHSDAGNQQLRVNNTEGVNIINSGLANLCDSGSGDLSVGTFGYVVATYDYSSGACIIYINGVSAGTGTTPTVFTAGASKVIGQRGFGLEYFTGTIDEVRVSDIIRTPAWILTEYNSQNAPNTFVTIGAEETDSVATTNYRRIIIAE